MAKIINIAYTDVRRQMIERKTGSSALTYIPVQNILEIQLGKTQISGTQFGRYQINPWKFKINSLIVRGMLNQLGIIDNLDQHLILANKMIYVIYDDGTKVQLFIPLKSFRHDFKNQVVQFEGVSMMGVFSLYNSAKPTIKVTVEEKERIITVPWNINFNSQLSEHLNQVIYPKGWNTENVQPNSVNIKLTNYLSYLRYIYITMGVCIFSNNNQNNIADDYFNPDNSPSYDGSNPRYYNGFVNSYTINYPAYSFFAVQQGLSSLFDQYVPLNVQSLYSTSTSDNNVYSYDQFVQICKKRKPNSLLIDYDTTTRVGKYYFQRFGIGFYGVCQGSEQTESQNGYIVNWNDIKSNLLSLGDDHLFTKLINSGYFKWQNGTTPMVKDAYQIAALSPEQLLQLSNGRHLISTVQQKPETISNNCPYHYYNLMNDGRPRKLMIQLIQGYYYYSAIDNASTRYYRTYENMYDKWTYRIQQYQLDPSNPIFINDQMSFVVTKTSQLSRQWNPQAVLLKNRLQQERNHADSDNPLTYKNDSFFIHNTPYMWFSYNNRHFLTTQQTVPKSYIWRPSIYSNIFQIKTTTPTYERTHLIGQISSNVAFLPGKLRYATGKDLCQYQILVQYLRLIRSAIVQKTHDSTKIGQLMFLLPIANSTVTDIEPENIIQYKYLEMVPKSNERIIIYQVFDNLSNSLYNNVYKIFIDSVSSQYNIRLQIQLVGAWQNDIIINRRFRTVYNTSTIYMLPIEGFITSIVYDQQNDTTILQGLCKMYIPEGISE